MGQGWLYVLNAKDVFCEKKQEIDTFTSYIEDENETFPKLGELLSNTNS